MAVKVVKPGQTVFNGFCDRCGCEFTYEVADLKLAASDKIACPTCGKDYYHLTKTKQKEVTEIPKLNYLTWPPEPIPCIVDGEKDPCADCAWLQDLLKNGSYIGDTPCTWCNKNKFRCNISSGEASSAIAACTTSVSECEVGGITTIHSASDVEADREYVNQKLQEVYDASGVKADDITQGTVMSTILNACHGCVGNLNKCDDTEGRNSCSGEHTYGGNKNCKGTH